MDNVHIPKTEYEQLLKHIKELEAQLDAFQWQPIETAPKDGTAILVNTGYAHDAWQYVTAHYRNDLWVACCSSSIVRPSHWMPLPEPPQALNGAEMRNHNWYEIKR